MHWLACPDHLEHNNCWVKLSKENWPHLADKSALWCYECRKPIAICRESQEFDIPQKKAARDVIEAWEDVCFYNSSLKGWDFSEVIEDLRNSLDG